MELRCPVRGGTSCFSACIECVYTPYLTLSQEPIQQVYDSQPSKQSSLSTRPRQPLSTHANGNSRPKTRSKNKSMQGLDAAYNSASTLKPPQRSYAEASDTGSGADSLLDLYKSSSKESLAKPLPKQRIKRKSSQGGVTALAVNQEDPDKWIHRDKLQQIEIREMLEEGRRLDLPTRAASKTGPKSSQAPTIVDEADVADDESSQVPEKKRQRVTSPGLSSQELQEEPSQDDRAFHNGVSTSTQPTSQGSPRARRPSTSRIPISRTSPAGDETPSSFQFDKTRRIRSGSQSSQNMLDTATTPRTFDSPRLASNNSPQESPPKGPSTAKNSSMRGRNSSRGGRAASGQTRPGTASSPANGTASRPGTSSGRPTTARAPEGDPPWISSMFKPDPRLPPDMQMLPTHAKRLAEQQMALDSQPDPPRRQGPFLVDDDDSPRANHDGGFSEDQRQQARNQYINDLQNTRTPSPQKTSSPHLSPLEQGGRDVSKHNSWRSQGKMSPSLAPSNDGTQWPLRTLSFNKYSQTQEQPAPQSQASPKSDTGSWASNNNREHGGYSLMPSVQSPKKEMEQRRDVWSPVPMQQRPSATQSGATQQPVRLPEEPEMDETKEKKGCAGCCIVM